MYSGTISIDDSDPTAQMFFVFEPTIGDPVDEITIWLNGVRLLKTCDARLDHF
jgi:carboxypeptidase D